MNDRKIILRLFLRNKLRKERISNKKQAISAALASDDVQEEIFLAHDEANEKGSFLDWLSEHWDEILTLLLQLLPLFLGKEDA